MIHYRPPECEGKTVLPHSGSDGFFFLSLLLQRPSLYKFKKRRGAQLQAVVHPGAKESRLGKSKCGVFNYPRES
jgi:hypothetical protein